MANAFYAAFGACKRRGFTSSYCHKKAKQELASKSARKRPSRRRRLPAGMARRGSTCRRMTKVFSPARGKKVLRCTGGYR